MREDHLNVTMINGTLGGLASKYPALFCTLKNLAMIIDREFYELAMQKGMKS